MLLMFDRKGVIATLRHIAKEPVTVISMKKDLQIGFFRTALLLASLETWGLAIRISGAEKDRWYITKVGQAFLRIFDAWPENAPEPMAFPQ